MLKFNSLRDFMNFLRTARLIFFLISFISVVFISAALVFFNQRINTNKKASEKKLSSEEYLNLVKKPEYVKGEVLIKLKPRTPSISVKTNNKPQGEDLDKKPVDISNLDENTLPKSIKTINQKYQVKTIEKVFKNASTPPQEIAKFKQKFSKEISEGKRGINEKELIKIDLSKTYKLSFDQKISVEKVIQEIKQNPEIEYAEPNYIVKNQQDNYPNDPYFQDSYPNNVVNRDPNWKPQYDYQWDLRKTGTDQAWKIASGSAEVIVAISDTGVDYTHPELGGCTLEQVNKEQCEKIVSGYDFVNNDNDPIDDNGHGTHVAGTIGALTNNNIGIAGIKGNVKIMPVKGLDSDGEGLISNLADGIKFAADNKANIINMSWGGIGEEGSNQTLTDALSYAYNLGVVLVAAAGNFNDDTHYFFPANDPHVIAVAATDPNDLKAYFSNWGEKIEVTAPGVNIISLRAKQTDLYCPSQCGSHIINQIYYRASGTSMAAPHVAGLAALILSKDKSLTPDRVKDIMAASSDDIGDSGFDIKFGYGRINVDRALTEISVLKTPPRARIISPVSSKENITKGPYEIKGTAIGDDFEKFVIEWTEWNIKDSQTEIWSSEEITLSGNGTKPIENNSLGVWTPSNLKTGIYKIRLKVFSGGKIAFYTTYINFDSSIKGLIKVPCSDSSSNSNPLVTDINNDGYQEIIIQCLTNLYVYSHNGNLMFKKPSASLPTIGELDPLYPGKEIALVEDFFLSQDSSKWKIMAWRGDGTPVPGSWPKEISFNISEVHYSPGLIIIEDIDIDGKNDLLVFEARYYKDRYQGAKVVALKADGTDLPGFQPFNTPRLNTSTWPQDLFSHFVADVAGDSKPEIISKEQFDLSVFNNQGTFIWKLEDTGLGPAAVGDIDLDGKKEIIIVKNYGEVDVLKWNGNGFTSRLLYQLAEASYTLAINKLQITDFNLDNKPEIILEIHKENIYQNDIPETFSSFFKYVVLSTDGKIISGFPGTPDLFFPSVLPDNLNHDPKDWYEYPTKWDTWLPYTPGNVVFGESQNQKYFAYEAMTLYDKLRLYQPSTYVEAFKYNGASINRLPGFPKKIINHWDVCLSCPSFYQTPVIADVDNDGKSEIVASASMPLKDFVIYIFALENSVTDFDWGQYLHDERRTGVYSTSVTLSPTPVPFTCDSACKADVKPDGRVNAMDYAILSSCYGKKATDKLSNGTSCQRADINGNGTVDQPDNDCLQSQYFKTCAQPTSSAAIPTPKPQVSSTINLSFSCNACTADVNKDKRVNNLDAIKVQSCLNRKPANLDRYGRPCKESDLDRNGTINKADLQCITTQLGKTCNTR